MTDKTVEADSPSALIVTTLSSTEFALKQEEDNLKSWHAGTASCKERMAKLRSKRDKQRAALRTLKRVGL